MIRPLTGPAPSWSMKARPAKTATAPVNPASGAHHGMAPIPSMDGNGRGATAKRPAKKKKFNPKSTASASQGFVREILNCALITAPKACNAPATMMKGVIKIGVMSLLPLFVVMAVTATKLQARWSAASAALRL
jgi:hypothetical protein